MTQKRKQDKDIRKAEMPKVLPERRPKGFSRMTFELAEDPTVLGYARSIKELKDARDKGGTLSDKNIFHPMNTEGASVDDVRRMIDEAKLIDRIRGQKELEKEEEVKKPVELGAAKGTSVPKQMEMFEEGGLRDEGGTTDPVSGNDVPPGSTQEEVRDDIPAQLSEGEFVFPADVVRYIGLEKLMMMRQEAKAGLARMEAMGQMGNADEATIPDDAPFNPSQDDLPFSMEDLDMEDEREYNEGGVVKAQTGTFVAPGQGFPSIPPGIPTPQQQVAGIAGFVPSQFQGQELPSFQPTMPTPNYNVPSVPLVQPFKSKVNQGEQTPTFQNLLGQTPGQYDELREYVNEAGGKLQIPFKDGQPIYPIPEGYSYVDPEATKTEEVTTKEVTPQTTQVTQQEEGDSALDDRVKQQNVENFGIENPTVISLGGQIDKKDGSVKNSMEFSYNVKPEGGVFSTSLPMSFGRSVASIVTGRSMVGDRDVVTLTPKGYPDVKIELTGKEFKDIVNVDTDDGKGKKISITNKKVQNFINNRVRGAIDNARTPSGMGRRELEEIDKGLRTARGTLKADLTQKQIDDATKAGKDALKKSPDTSDIVKVGQTPQVDSGSDDPSGGFTGTTPSGQSFTESGYGQSGGPGDFKQGGLLKKKTKVKKMKRGGLASR